MLDALVPLDPLMVAAAIGLTVLVFARAVLHKVSEFETFRQTVEDYRILPPALVPAAAAGLVAAEGAVMLGLILPWTRPAAVLGAAALLILYAGAMAANLVQGRTSIDCGCGGQGQGISWTLVGRNLVLAGVAGLVLVPVAERPLGFLDIVAIPLMVTTIWLVILMVEQLARTFAHIRAMRENGIE